MSKMSPDSDSSPSSTKRMGTRQTLVPLQLRAEPRLKTVSNDDIVLLGKILETAELIVTRESTLDVYDPNDVEGALMCARDEADEGVRKVSPYSRAALRAAAWALIAAKRTST